jgi:transglutaminase-like putative cysteine protease
MSSWALRAGRPLAQPARLQVARAAPAESLALRLAAFAALAGFASVHYAQLVIAPPAGRIAAVVAVATGAGFAIAHAGRVPGGQGVALAARALIALAALYIGLLAIGVPGRMLLHWGAFAQNLRLGFNRLTGWLWPYRGADDWARLSVLALIPAALVAAAALTFSPRSAAIGRRRLVALGLLIALYITGTVNVQAGGWTIQGIELVALVVAWLWLPTLGTADAGRALRWLLCSAALAVAVAPSLSASRPWINYKAWNPLGVSDAFQWDQLYGPISWSRSTATMFTVSGVGPRLWKVTSLDRFDGIRFLRSPAPPGSQAFDLGEQPGQGEWYEPETVTVAGLRSNLLVGGGEPVQVDWLSTDRQSSSSQADGTTALASPLARTDSYYVIVYAPRPTPAQLRAVPRGFPRAYLRYAQFELPGPGQSGLGAADLAAEARMPARAAALVGPPAPGIAPAADPHTASRVLDSPYAGMFELARRLAAGQRTTYDVVARIERFLRESYGYDETVPQHAYPLEAFLFEDRRGYCQQFSGAMTLMLRMLGIPARVAAGFDPGIYDPHTSQSRVRALDAHSWVEVYFAGIGWVPFDPTPPRTARPSIGRGALAALGTSSASLRVGPPRGAGERLAGPRGLGAVAHRARRGADLPLIIFVALLGLLATALVGWWIAAARRLRRALAGDASGAVRELVAALERLGQRVPLGTTLTELEARLELERGPGAARYVRLLRERRYAPARSLGPTAGDRRSLRRALLAGRSTAGRLRVLLALPPGAARSLR